MPSAPIRVHHPSAPTRRAVKGSVFSSPWAVRTLGPFAKPRSSSGALPGAPTGARMPAQNPKSSVIFVIFQRARSGRNPASEGWAFFFPMGPETSETSAAAALGIGSATGPLSGDVGRAQAPLGRLPRRPGVRRLPQERARSCPGGSASLSIPPHPKSEKARRPQGGGGEPMSGSEGLKASWHA
jgi:hypothetical protein